VSSLARRAAAAVIDQALLAVVLTSAFLWWALQRSDIEQVQADLDSGQHSGSLSLLFLVLSLTYFFLSEATRGETLGKRLVGLRVVTVAGSPPPVRAVAVRTVLRIVDGQLFYLYVVGLLVARFSGPRRQRLGDHAAGTVVVHERRPRR
jgi:uncharacterized RDD family membrane protein YckC